MAFSITLQNDGLPVSHYGNYKGIEIGDQLSITAVAEVGLYYWNTFFSESSSRVFLSYDWDHQWPVNREALPKDQETAKVKIQNCANVLVQKAQPHGDWVIWTYPYAFSYNTKPDWMSSQAQISAVQLLMRASDLLSDHRLMEMANQGLRAFLVTTDRGGLANQSSDGWWYEKFISPGNDKPMILNGMMFVLLGLHDVFLRASDHEIKHAFDMGVKGLVKNLPRFDTGNWSAYDIFGKPASPHYHDIHIHQLRMLYLLTQEPILKKYAQRFEWYKTKRKFLDLIRSWFQKSKKTKKKIRI